MSIISNETSLVANTAYNIPGLQQPTEQNNDVLLLETTKNDFAVATTSPATLVSLSTATNITEAPSTYDQPTIEVTQVRNQLDTTPVAAAISKQLVTNLKNINSSKNNFSVSNFFNQIGALSRETSEYKNEARTAKVASDKVSDKFKLDFSVGAGKPQSTVNFSIRTKDGDIIDIKIQHSSSGKGNSLEFSFSVKGKLSAAEQDALDKLATKLGGVADDFFRTGTAELHGLKEFDQTNLQDFHIEFIKPKGDTYVTHSYDYSVDDTGQHLIAKDTNDYSIDIKANLQDLLSKSYSAKNNSLEAYLDIIRKALNDHQTSSASKRFLLDGFSSLLNIDAPVKTQPNQLPAEDILDNFSTGLPDFNATISAPGIHDLRDYLHPETLNLILSQKTEYEQVEHRALIKQTNAYELNSSHSKGIMGTDNADLDSGNFTYKTTHEKQSISRLLDMSEKDINNMITEKSSSVNNTEQTFNHFHLEDSHKTQYTNSQLEQLNDRVHAQKQFNGLLDGLKKLSDSTKHLFAG